MQIMERWCHTEYLIGHNRNCTSHLEGHAKNRLHPGPVPVYQYNTMYLQTFCVVSTICSNSWPVIKYQLIKPNFWSRTIVLLYVSAKEGQILFLMPSLYFSLLFILRKKVLFCAILVIILGAPGQKSRPKISATLADTVWKRPVIKYEQTNNQTTTIMCSRRGWKFGHRWYMQFPLNLHIIEVPFVRMATRDSLWVSRGAPLEWGLLHPGGTTGCVAGQRVMF